MAYSQADVMAAQAAVPPISVADARALIVERDALLVDVREPDEWAGGYLDGAHHTPLGQVPFRADADSPHHDPAFRLDRPIILYCRGGSRSALAGKALLDAGYTEVFNLGGAQDAVNDGWPVAG